MSDRARVPGLRLSVTLLTVVPIRVDRADRAASRGAMLWAPAVGLLAGAPAALILLAAGLLDASPLLGAALAVAASAAFTRALHLDGLADLADGLGSGRPADEALDVMKRSDIGPFGVVTLLLTLLVQVAALAAVPDPPATALVAAVTGRLALPWACRAGVPPARPDGLGAMVAGTVPTGAALLITALAAAAATFTGTLTAAVAVLAGVGAALLVLRRAVRRLGGVTGDVLGAVVEVAATVALVVMAARG